MSTSVREVDSLTLTEIRQAASVAEIPGSREDQAKESPRENSGDRDFYIDRVFLPGFVSCFVNRHYGILRGLLPVTGNVRH